MNVENITEGQIITIKNQNYFVIAFEPLNTEKYPTLARYTNGTVYMRKGLKGHVYSVVVDKNNNMRINRPLIDCGKWDQSDVKKLTDSIKRA